MAKKFMAVFVALLTGTVTIYLVEKLGHQFFPLPEGLDFKDRAAVEEYMKNIEPAALAAVLMAYAAGAFVAGAVANLLMDKKGLQQVWIAAGLLTAAGLLNLITLPHPLWFIIIGAIIYFPFAYLGYKYTLQLKNPIKDENKS